VHGVRSKGLTSAERRSRLDRPQSSFVDSRWVKHCLFVSYHQGGAIASAGALAHGVEHGPWEGFHPNEQLAVLGSQDHGTEVDGRQSAGRRKVSRRPDRERYDSGRRSAEIMWSTSELQRDTIIGIPNH